MGKGEIDASGAEERGGQVCGKKRKVLGGATGDPPRSPQAAKRRPGSRQGGKSEAASPGKAADRAPLFAIPKRRLLETVAPGEQDRPQPQPRPDGDRPQRQDQRPHTRQHDDRHEQEHQQQQRQQEKGSARWQCEERVPAEGQHQQPRRDEREAPRGRRPQQEQAVGRAEAREEAKPARQRQELPMQERPPMHQRQRAREPWRQPLCLERVCCVH